MNPSYGWPCFQVEDETPSSLLSLLHLCGAAGAEAHSDLQPGRNRDSADIEQPSTDIYFSIAHLEVVGLQGSLVESKSLTSGDMESICQS